MITKKVYFYGLKYHKMKKLYSPFFLRTAFVVLFMLSFVRGWGQYSITGTGSSNTYTQNFNSWAGSNTTPATNWTISATGGGYYNRNTGTYSANNLYALRDNASATDIAVGGKVAANSGNCSGNGTRTIIFSVINNTGAPINGFVINWNVEQYSQGGRATTLNLTHNFGGTTNGTNNYTATTGTEGNLSSILTTARGVTITDINLLNNSSGLFTFTICTGSGSGNNAHVGIDDFTVYATAASTNDTTSEVDGPVLAFQPDPIISSLADTDAEAVKVFDFDIYDYGTADGLPTHVTQVTIKPGANNTANWANSIQNAKLSLNGGTTFVTTGTPVITAGSIVFPITSGNLDIADSDGETVSLFVYLKNSGLVDNSILEFSVPASAHGFTANSTGSTFATTFANATVSNEMLIDVEASKLIVGTQPSATACPNTNLTTAPVFRATDANNNIDTDFTNQVTLSNSGSLGMANASLNAISGVATFTNLQFTATGTVTLNASATGITASPTSNSVVISVANATGFSATNGNAQSVVGWTNPSCFDEVMIVAKAGSAVTTAPSGDGSAYTGNLSFSAGTSFDGGFVIYNGSASPQTLTNLINGTTYHLTIFTRKGTAWSVGATTTCTPNLASSSTDHFRSNVVAGTWAIPANWQSSPTGGVADSEWITATLAPTSSANSITVRSGHTINIESSVTADQIVVDGTLNVNATTTTSGTLTVANGVGDDLVVNGIVNVNKAPSGSNVGDISSSAGTIVFNADSQYNHNRNAGTIPIASWNSRSTCNIIGITSSTIAVSSLNQTFGNLIWNNTGQTTFVNLDATVTTFSVLGTFSVLSTGTRAFNFNSASATAKNYTINNFLIAGTSQVQMSFLTGSNVPVTTLNVLGDLTLQDSAILDFGANTGNGPIYFGSNRYRSMIKLAGNLSASSGSSLIIGNNTSYGIIEFDNTSVKNLVIQNPNTSSVLFEVLPASKVALQSDIVLDSFNGFDVEGTLDLGTHTITGIDGDFNYFYNYPNSTLRIAHPEGIASLLTYPTTGAVRVDANSEGYDIGANYVYYGVSNQITGNGLPEFIKNITIENTGITGSNEVTLTNTALGVSDNLFVSNGIFNTSDKEVYGGGVSSSELRVNSGAELKIGGTRTFPLNFGVISFQPLSNVHYAGQTQTIANVNVTDYLNLPAYENLKVSGTGVKTAKGTTTVNEMTKITAVTTKLVVPSPLTDTEENVFYALGGIENTDLAGDVTGDFIIENDAMLMQNPSADNSKAVIKSRKLHTYKNDDREEYNFLSSPVAKQNMKAIYGNNAANVPFVTKLNEPTNFFVNATPADWDGDDDRAKGFAVREPRFAGFVPDPVDNLPDAMAQYRGKPNNGDIDLILSYTPNRGYNLAGNPYPSNLDILELYTNSTDIDPTFRFWDNTVNSLYTQQGGAYKGYSYALFNATTDSDGYGTKAPGAAEGTREPYRVIKVSQAFMIRAKTNASKLKFQNAQRSESNVNTTFYGRASTKNRYRLELVKSDGFTVQNAIAYFDAGNNAFGLEDSRIPNAESSDALFSFAGDAKVVINGRSTFATEDVVTLGLRHFTTGTYKIQVVDEEGVFANGQKIYLKDKQLNILTDLTAGSYTFTSEPGEFTNRFEIVYKEGLVLATDGTEKSSIQVYRDGGNFVVKSTSKNINAFELYDASGRLVLTKQPKAKQLTFGSEILTEGMYIVKAVMENGEQLTKKIRK